MEHPGLQTSLRDLTFVLFKRKWSIIIIFVTAMLSVVVWLWLIREDVYEVDASLLVKLGHEQSIPPTMLGERPMLVTQRYQDVNSEASIIQNTELIAQVVDYLGLDKPPQPQPVPDKLLPRLRYYGKQAVKWVKDEYEEILITVGLRERLTQREKVIMTFKEGLHVTPEKDSNVLIATLFFPIRQGASVVLNTLLDFYQNFRPKVFYDQSAMEFFTGQVQQSLLDLQNAEKELRRFESASNISVIAKQQEVLLQQISETQVALDAAKVSLEEIAWKVARFNEQRNQENPNLATLGAFDKGSFPDSLLLQLAELQRERERLRTLEFDDGVRIQNNRSQFAILMGMLGSNLRSMLAERRTMHDARKKGLSALQTRLNSLHGREMKWSELKRKVKVLEETYIFNRRKIEEARAAAALEREHVGNVVVIEHAMDALAPSGMRKTTLLGIALGVTLFAALAWVSIVEFFDHRLYTPEALNEYLSVPVIAVVPVGRTRRIWGRGSETRPSWQRTDRRAE